MKLSTRVRYGTRFMMELALQEAQTDHPILLEKICEAQQISQKYLSRLVLPLIKNGLIRSIQGAKGGYRMNRSAENITVREIAEAIDGPLELLPCVSTPEQCERSSICASRDVWTVLGDHMKQSLEAFTLKAVLDLYLTKQSIAHLK